MPKNTKGIRKYQQIQHANRTMFIWVAVASALVGAALVLSVTLFGQIMFKQKVIGEKNTTVQTLKKNNEVVTDLNDNIRLLESNRALGETPQPEDSKALAVILDALPSQANSSALGASLQQKLLNVPGVTVESLNVTPIAGVENSGEDTTADSSVGDNTISFQFSVSVKSGEGSLLKQVLQNLEKSIRAINVQSVEVQTSSEKITMNVKAVAYYQPEATIELSTKAVQP